MNQPEMHDAVNHPSHYTDGKIEVINFIEDKKLPYHLGNVVKYVCRAGKKNPATEIEDLKKAQWYLGKYIGLLAATTVDASGKDINVATTVYLDRVAGGRDIPSAKEIEKERAAYCEKVRDCTKACQIECGRCGLYAPSEEAGMDCDEWARVHPTEALEIMRKAGGVMKQRCGNCEYYGAAYCECEHPEQVVYGSDSLSPENGTGCKLWEYGCEPESEATR